MAYLIFSLYRILGKDAFEKILVIDNGSNDGSLSMLLDMEKNNLIELLVNERDQYHGPALNQAFSYLAAQRAKEGRLPVKDYVWILDSDTIILRKDSLQKALSYLVTSKSAIVGECGFKNERKLDANLWSLLVDPQVVWQPSMPLFTNGGAPSVLIQQTLRKRGIEIGHFPFMIDALVFHFGSGTVLTALAHKKMSSHIWYKWAKHWAPLGLRKNYDAEQDHIYRQFLRLFHSQCPVFDTTSLINACKKQSLLTMDMIDDLHKKGPVSHRIE